MDTGISSYRRFLEGDDAGLERIIELYSDGLMLFIYELVRDIHAAEDLMEDAFAELIFRKGQFREDASLKTYLYRTGRNKALNYLRKNSLISFFGDNPVKEERDETQDIESIVLGRERRREIFDAVDKLRPDYRQVVYLLYFEEMSYAQAGKVMSKTEKQIKNLAYRARQSLKEILKKENCDYEEL